MRAAGTSASGTRGCAPPSRRAAGRAPPRWRPSSTPRSPTSATAPRPTISPCSCCACVMIRREGRPELPPHVPDHRPDDAADARRGSGRGDSGAGLIELGLELELVLAEQDDERLARAPRQTERGGGIVRLVIGGDDARA